MLELAKKPATRRRRREWLMSDTDRQLREFEAGADQRSPAPEVGPVKQPEQLYDHIEVEEEER